MSSCNCLSNLLLMYVDGSHTNIKNLYCYRYFIYSFIVIIRFFFSNSQERHFSLIFHFCLHSLKQVCLRIYFVNIFVCSIGILYDWSWRCYVLLVYSTKTYGYLLRNRSAFLPENICKVLREVFSPLWKKTV